MSDRETFLTSAHRAKKASERRSLCAMGVLILSIAAMAKPSVVEQARPVTYTVTTSDADKTNLLEVAKVEIDSQGAVTIVNFSEITEFAPDSIFRKRGEGFLKSCSKMGSFTGEIRIEEGAFIIEDVGQMGPCVENSSSDPRVVVSNGASLVVAAVEGLANNRIRFCGGLQIAGDGYKGIGAVRSESRSRIKYFFSSDISLDGNATMVNASPLADEDDAQWGANGRVNLNSFSLTFSGRRFWNYAVSFVNPGHVIVDGDGYVQFQGYKTWDGSSENTLTVKSGGVMEFYSQSKLETLWTLILEEGAQLRSATQESIGPVGKFYWKGPVTVNGRVKVRHTSTKAGFELHGAVSGSGGFDLYNGGLELLSPENSFTGGVCASMTSDSFPTALGLGAGTALPSALAATNSNLSLYPSLDFSLPPLSFHVEAGRTNGISGGAGGTMASLLKTGQGTLELESPLAATGDTVLEGGTLRLSPELSAYSPTPGLIESRHVASSKDEWVAMFDDWYSNGTTMNTNRVVSLPEGATENHEDSSNKALPYEFIRYKGYIWNRADHDVTWTFAVAICPQSILFIGDGENMPESATIVRTTSNWKNDGPGLATVTLSPGPHYFDLRMASSHANGSPYNKAGARSDCEKAVNWPGNYGFAIDFEGRGSYDGTCYSIPSNNVTGSVAGGDGSLFTVDARTYGDAPCGSDGGVSLPSLCAMPGSVLDLNAPGRTFAVQELSGMADVVNGNLHVENRWSVSGEDMALLKPLTGDGKITFGKGWTLAVSKPEAVWGRIPIAVAREGGLTLPAHIECENDAAGNWHLELSSDGKKLEIVRRWFYIIIR